MTHERPGVDRDGSAGLTENPDRVGLTGIDDRKPVGGDGPAGDLIVTETIRGVADAEKTVAVGRRQSDGTTGLITCASPGGVAPEVHVGRREIGARTDQQHAPRRGTTAHGESSRGAGTCRDFQATCVNRDGSGESVRA